MPAPQRGAAPILQTNILYLEDGTQCLGLDSKPTLRATGSPMLRPSGVQLFSPKTPRGTGPGTQEVTSECLLNVRSNTLSLETAPPTAMALPPQREVRSHLYTCLSRSWDLLPLTTLRFPNIP